MKAKNLNVAIMVSAAARRTNDGAVCATLQEDCTIAAAMGNTQGYRAAIPLANAAQTGNGVTICNVFARIFTALNLYGGTIGVGHQIESSRATA